MVYPAFPHMCIKLCTCCGCSVDNCPNVPIASPARSRSSAIDARSARGRRLSGGCRPRASVPGPPAGKLRRTGAGAVRTWPSSCPPAPAIHMCITLCTTRGQFGDKAGRKSGYYPQALAQTIKTTLCTLGTENGSVDLGAERLKIHPEKLRNSKDESYRVCDNKIPLDGSSANGIAPR